MLVKFFKFLFNLSPAIKRALWRKWYQVMAKKYQLPDWNFMNYGYAELDGSELDLHDHQEKERYFIQLYHYVAAAVDLDGKKVLEIGSGRGGGASYVARVLYPEEMVGLDYSANAVDFSNKNNAGDNLSFVEGDAENLPFENESYDVVLNVESSHCYGDMQQFVHEVYRILKPGGYFSWADLRGAEEGLELPGIFKNAGFETKQEGTITPQVLHALDLIHDRKMDMIEENVPVFIQSAFKDFAGVKDSKIYNALKDGSAVYLRYVLQKPV
jgi:ubiquinone/menaquinone biosynthesis C-methylase UbiE